MKIPDIINFKAFVGLETFERVRNGRALAGVCTAIAELTNVHVVKIRLLTIILISFSGGGLFGLYLFLWFILPLREKEIFPKKIFTSRKKAFYKEKKDEVQ